MRSRRISRYFDIVRKPDGQDVLEAYVDGIALLRLALTNRGTGFTESERIELGLDGLLPPAVNTLEQQVERAYAGYQEQTSDIAKYQYLRALQDRHEILFFAVLEKHLREMLPIVYTPTVGEAVQKFHLLFQRPRGLSLSPRNIDRAKLAMANYPWEDVRMIVATDSSAILGIGDQGYGGLGICIGKLALYTVAGGVSPLHTMPVGLDVGTDRRDLREDPLYLGIREKRLRGEQYMEFVDKFVDAVQERFPDAIIQWEDLSKEAAFAVLDRYRDRIPSFNDDIQGTGAVTLAGVLSACRLKGERLRDQRIVIHGAGAGGIGVAWALHQGMLREGLTPEQARERIYVLDSKGLLTTDRTMEGYKRPYAQEAERVRDWAQRGELVSLSETLRGAKATVLLGLSGQPDAFGEEDVRILLGHTPRPIIFPLSNPTSSCEARPADLLYWTDGAAIVATGSPFAPVTSGSKAIEIGQGNNAFIFPGLGFGAILSRARRITDGMVLEAAYALADYTKEHYGHEERVYPPVEDLQNVSVAVTCRVLLQSALDGVSTLPALRQADAEAFVRANFWKPEYIPIRRGRLPEPS